jgi:predicted  nucleic acid-binding Zn-ribbon protein
MVSNPEPCPDCGGQLFTAIWSLYAKDANGERDGQAKPNPHDENGTDLRQDGVECINCGTKQFHRGVPERHENQHGLPQGAADNRPNTQ